MDSGNTGRSKKVVGLFLAAALTLTPGCSMNPFEWGRNDASCTDVNRDGYCDEDGRPVSSVSNRSHRTGFYRFFGGGSSSQTSVSPSGSSSRGVSSGSKGGIGSSSRSGGGSSGG